MVQDTAKVGLTAASVQTLLCGWKMNCVDSCDSLAR